MHRHIINILFTLLFSAATSVFALPTTYSCDYEDAAENALWTLNTPKNENYNWPNLWYIGSAGAMAGNNGLYISADGGNKASYSSTEELPSSMMVAYREIALEAGSYEMTFNWRAGGTGKAYMIAAWVPQADFGKILCALNDEWKERSWIKDNLLKFQNEEFEITQFTGSLEWQQSSTAFTSDGTPHRLLFVWVSDGSAANEGLSVSVDNILIARNNCGAPKNLSTQTSDMDVRLTWETNSDSVNIRYIKVGDKDFIYRNNLTAQELDLSLQEGVYYFYLQVICKGEESRWYKFPAAVVHSSACFDFLNLTNDRCYYNNSSGAGTATVFEQGKQDEGYRSILSMHTVHYVLEEDSYTLGSTDANGNPVPALKTIPDGEIASVRLGWRGTTGKAARVVYEYTVDKQEAALLMLQYAVVMQMANHSEGEQPKFTLDIKDARTGKVLETCTSVDFSPKKNSTMEGWYYNGPVTNSSTWTWKDWTTVGLNLEKYHGRKVRIELSSYGCTPTGHGGYAYYTIRCTSGRLEGIQCGDTPTNEFIAPEGFNYRWYKQYESPNTPLTTDGMGNPLTLASREFKVDYKDTITYRVDVHQKTDDNCYFSLIANAMPRYPIPEAQPVITYEDCKAKVKFTNTSHIRTKDLNTGKIYETTTLPDRLFWNFGNVAKATDEWEPELELESGKYSFSLMASVGKCDSTQVIDIEIPLLQDTVVEEDVQRCYGEIYNYQDKMITADTVITQYLKRFTGCDSTHIINLHFVDNIQAVIDTAIVEGESVIFGMRVYKEAGTYTDTYTSQAGCDSTIVLNLTVNPRLKVNTEVQYPCADENQLAMALTSEKGVVNSCYVKFNEEAHLAGFRDTIFSDLPSDTTYVELIIENENMKAGWYEANLYFNSLANGTDSATVEFMVRYPSSVLSQRWNDVLGISNTIQDQNSELVGYKWYRQGVALNNDTTEAYLYVPEEFVEGDEYSVEIFQAGKQRGIMSCPIRVVHIEQNQISVTPTLTPKGSAVRIRSPFPLCVNLYSIDGLHLSSWQMQEGTTEVKMPDRAGIYIMHLLSSKEQKTIKIKLTN